MTAPDPWAEGDTLIEADLVPTGPGQLNLSAWARVRYWARRLKPPSATEVSVSEISAAEVAPATNFGDL